MQAYGVLNATQIYKGALVSVNAAGWLVPSTNTSGELVVGIAQNNVLGSAVAGEEKCNVRKGVFSLNGEGGDLPTQALVGHGVYAASDNEVELTAGAGAVFAGTLEEIDGAEYWVRIFDQSVT